VNVGANGFLDKNELSVVCEHIGMEGIDEDVSIRLLFSYNKGLSLLDLYRNSLEVIDIYTCIN
jgi:hypothetical protein